MKIIAATRCVETVSCLAEMIQQVLSDDGPDANPGLAACVERFVGTELRMAVMQLSGIVEEVGGYRYVPVRELPAFDMSPAASAHEEAPQPPPFRTI